MENFHLDFLNMLYILLSQIYQYWYMHDCWLNVPRAKNQNSGIWPIIKSGFSKKRNCRGMGTVHEIEFLRIFL